MRVMLNPNLATHGGELPGFNKTWTWGTGHHFSLFMGGCGAKVLPHSLDETGPIPAPKDRVCCSPASPSLSSASLGQGTAPSPRLRRGTPLVAQGGTSHRSPSASIGMGKWGKNHN